MGQDPTQRDRAAHSKPSQLYLSGDLSYHARTHCTSNACAWTHYLYTFISETWIPGLCGRDLQGGRSWAMCGGWRTRRTAWGRRTAGCVWWDRWYDRVMGCYGCRGREGVCEECRSWDLVARSWCWEMLAPAARHGRRLDCGNKNHVIWPLCPACADSQAGHRLAATRGRGRDPMQCNAARPGYDSRNPCTW